MPPAVLIISRCPPYPLHLGDRLIIWHLARELQARGWQVDLLAFSQSEEDAADIKLYEHLFRYVQLIPEPPRGPGYYLRRVLWPWSRYPKKAQQSSSPAMWQAIRKRIASHSYDALHCFGSVQVYEYQGAFDGQPALITPYESYSLFLERQFAQTGDMIDRIRRLVARQFESWMFRRYRTTVVVAPPDQALLQRLNPMLNIEVISNGIDTEYFHGRSSGRSPARLLFTGNYEYGPNLEAALYLVEEILPKLLEKRTDLHIWLAGNGPPRELRDYQGDHVTVTGRVPDLRPYLSTAAVFVCPLLSGAGIKNKVLEALAMRLPVLATPLSVDGIDVKDGKHVRLCEAEEMADALLQLLDDAPLRAQLAENGRRLIEERYTWGQIAERYIALYQQIEESRPEPVR